MNDECRTRKLHSSSPVEVTPGSPRNKFRNQQMFMQFVVGPMSSPCHTVTTVMTTERELRRARRWNPHAIRSVESIYSIQNIHDELIMDVLNAENVTTRVVSNTTLLMKDTAVVGEEDRQRDPRDACRMK